MNYFMVILILEIPVAVSAALAVQEIFEKGIFLTKVKNLSEYFQGHSLKFKMHQNKRLVFGGIDIQMRDKPVSWFKSTRML